MFPSKTLAAALALTLLAPALAAADPADPVLYAYEGVHGTAFDTAEDGLALATDTYAVGQGFAFDTAAWGLEAGVAFAGGVHSDAFGAADDLLGGTVAQADQAHGLAFAGVDSAAGLAVEGYSGLHSAGFTLGTNALAAGVDTYDDTHGAGFGAAESAYGSGVGLVATGEDAAWEGDEGIRRLAGGISDPLQQRAASSSIPGAGQGSSRPSPMSYGMPDPYSSSYYTGCTDLWYYRVVAFPDRTSFNQGKPVYNSSQCTPIGTPILLGKSPVDTIKDSAECLVRAREAPTCFWFGPDADASQVRFDAYNRGGSYGQFYLVRLLVGPSVSIDFEVLPDDLLPDRTSAVFGGGSDAWAVYTVLNGWSSKDLHAEVTPTHGVSDVFAVHANLGSAGFDVQFGKVWDGSSWSGRTAQGPYTAEISTVEHSGGAKDIDVTLTQAAEQEGNNLVFGFGDAKTRHAAYGLHILRLPPTPLEVELHTAPEPPQSGLGTFNVERAHATAPVDLVLMGDVLGSGRVTATGVADIEGLGVQYSKRQTRNNSGDGFCDAAAADAYAAHDDFAQLLGQACITLGSITPNARIDFTDGFGFTARGLTGGDLALTLGPGDLVWLRTGGNAPVIEVQDLAVGGVSVRSVTATDLDSFLYVGGQRGNEPTWEMIGDFAATGANGLKLRFQAPGLGMEAQLQQIGRLHLKALGGADPFVLDVTGSPYLTIAKLVLDIDNGNDHFDFSQVSSKLLRHLQFKNRSGAYYDLCVPFQQWGCWPPMAVTVGIDNGGSVSIGGSFYKEISGWPDMQGDLRVSFERHPSWWGNDRYWASTEVSGTWCAMDDDEDRGPHGQGWLAVCETNFLDFYTEG